MTLDDCFLIFLKFVEIFNGLSVTYDDHFLTFVTFIVILVGFCGKRTFDVRLDTRELL